MHASSLGFYFILFFFFSSLFIEGFHLDPLPEPLGSYMSGKNYCLSKKKESVILMPCIFIAPNDKMIFKIASIYASAKQKTRQIKEKKKRRKSESAGIR